MILNLDIVSIFLYLCFILVLLAKFFYDNIFIPIFSNHSFERLFKFFVVLLAVHLLPVSSVVLKFWSQSFVINVFFTCRVLSKSTWRSSTFHSTLIEITCGVECSQTKSLKRVDEKSKLCFPTNLKRVSLATLIFSRNF